MLRTLVLLALVQFLAGYVQVPVNDKNWYFTEWNWYLDPGAKFAQSANPGAYFKVGFTGTSACLLLNLTLAPTEPFMVVAYSVDQQPFVVLTLERTADTSPTCLATGLQNGNHQLLFYLKASVQTNDRWLYGPVDRLNIEGLILDDGAATLPVYLRPKRMMIYWDSIGEGVNVIADIQQGGDLQQNDGTATWAMALAQGMDAEVSVVAFGRQGYLREGNGNVPPLITPGNDSASAWNKFDADFYRFNGSVPSLQPDYIYCGHATNDQGYTPEEVTEKALAWLKAMRQTTPKSSIFLVIPFGQFQADAITDAFSTYQSNSNDKNAFLIPLGDEAAIGLNGQGPSLYAVDGIHPLWRRDGQLGAMLVERSLMALSTN